jgi:regulator of sigma E protease
MTALLIAGLIALLVLVHEAGHLLAGLYARIPLARFSVGFGPALWGFTRRGVEFRLSAVPLGGYVLPAFQDLDDYFKIPVRRRILFALGGPAFNLLLPVPLFALYNVFTRGPSLEGLFVLPFVQTGQLVLQVVSSIPLLFTNAAALSGPVGVVAEGSRLVGFSGTKALFFSALLSVNFAVFNLLPVPILDGGKILLSLMEKIWPRSVRLFVPATAVSLVLLLLLFAYATVADVARMTT